MPQIYLHYFGNESSESLLEAAGIITKDHRVDPLKPKQCPNCTEPNKPDSKFCARCRMVLSYDAYSKTIEDKQSKEEDVRILREDITLLKEALSDVQQLLKDPSKLSEISKY
jgi:hypothetical protein